MADDVDALRLRGFEVTRCRDKHGCSVLHWAAGGGSVPAVRYLVVEQGMDVDEAAWPAKARLAPTTAGRRPLHFAARNDRLAVARFLVENGADPDSRAHRGVTPLQLAVWRNNEATARYLVECGADLDQTNAVGCSLAHWLAIGPTTALAKGLGLAEWLREARGDAFFVQRNAHGHTPLHKAAFAGHGVLCAWLLDRGADASCFDHAGKTPSDEAAAAGHEDLALWLRQVHDRDRLGIPRDACSVDVARAFRREARRAHPDKGGSDAAFVAATQARDALSDETTRAARFRALLPTLLRVLEPALDMPAALLRAQLVATVLEHGDDGIDAPHLPKKFHRLWGHALDISDRRAIGLPRGGGLLRVLTHPSFESVFRVERPHGGGAPRVFSRLRLDDEQRSIGLGPE